MSLAHQPSAWIPVTRVLAASWRRSGSIVVSVIIMLALAVTVADAGDVGTVNVKPVAKQTFSGFGAFMGYGVGYNVNYSLTHGGTAGVDALFDRAFATDQLNLQYLRLNIDPRFQEGAAREEIAVDDRALEAFTSQVTMAQKAKARNAAVKLCFSVFRPPHWMRVGNETINQGEGAAWWHAAGVTDVSQFWRDATRSANRLREDQRDAFALYLSQFCQRFHALSGYWPDYLAVQNEPDLNSGTGVDYSSCTYTPENYGAVSRIVKQRFITDGVPTRLMGPEFSYQAFGGADQEYYRRMFIAAGAAIAGQPIIDVGAIHCYGDGFSAQWTEMSQGTLWGTEYSFSGRGMTNFNPDLPRSAAWFGAIVATRLQRGHISSLWWFNLMEKAGSPSLPESLLTTDGDGGSHIITTHALTRTACVLRQLATTIIPGSVVQDTEFFWNGGSETYDVGYSATIYPAAVACKRPDGRHVLVFVNPTLQTFTNVINLQVPALSTAGVQTWTRRLTDATHGDTADGTVSFTNGYAKNGFSVPPQSVITLLEPTVVGGIAPSITTSAIITGTVGVAYTYDVNASGAPAPTFALSGAPVGMTIDSATGVITWTPSSSGSVSFTIVATNGIAPNATQNVTLTIAAASTPGSGVPTSKNSGGSSGCGLGSAAATLVGLLGLTLLVAGMSDPNTKPRS
jgi:O-glycosyl hydrolase